MERSEADTARGTNLAKLQIEKSDLMIQLNFDQPMWVLAKDVSALYSSLVARMADFGVTTQAIRTDTGDGTLAGYNVNFWILQYGAIVRIRLDTVEVTCPNLATVNIEQLDSAFQRLWEALVSADPALSVRSSQVTLAMHGQPNGVDAREFLVRFVRATPTGLGENLGAGVVFYFGERPPLTFSSVSADLS